MRPASAKPTAEHPAALEYAVNVFRDQLRRDPDGPYAEHYKRALDYALRRMKELR